MVREQDERHRYWRTGLRGSTPPKVKLNSWTSLTVGQPCPLLSPHRHSIGEVYVFAIQKAPRPSCWASRTSPASP